MIEKSKNDEDEDEIDGEDVNFCHTSEGTFEKPTTTFFTRMFLAQ